MGIQKVGVVGFGVMGTGIAQVCAQAGLDVVISARSQEKAGKGIASIDKALGKSVEKGKLTAEAKAGILSRISGVVADSDYAGFSTCDLVIEAVAEDIENKKAVFGRLDLACKPEALLATNTSTLSVIDVAGVTRRPGQVLGLHFFNPVPIMQLVEVVKTIATTTETLDAGLTFVKTLGKTSVVSPDIPGLLANRLIAGLYLTAIRMLEANAASAKDIDAALCLGYNHPMGPLAVMDLIGLDVFLKSINGIYEGTQDPQYAPPTLLKKLVAVGWLGRKTGKGFHEYR